MEKEQLKVLLLVIGKEEVKRNKIQGLALIISRVLKIDMEFKPIELSPGFYSEVVDELLNKYNGELFALLNGKVKLLAEGIKQYDKIVEELTKDGMENLVKVTLALKRVEDKDLVQLIQYMFPEFRLKKLSKEEDTNE